MNKKLGFFQIKWNSLKFNVLKSAYFFCATTPLHGLNYLVIKSHTKIERIFWQIVVILSFIVGIVLVTLLWAWDTKAPTIIIAETTTYNARNIPFPAVTICNFNAISKNKSLQLASTLRRPKDITVEQVAELFILTINEKYQGTSKYNSKEILKSIMKDNDLSVGVLLESIQPNCLEMFFFCLWEGIGENCNDLFQPVAVETTVCCSTNFFGKKRSKEMKIAKRVLKEPLKSYGAGYPYGLTIGMRSFIEDYFGTTSIPGRGFTVHVHDAYTDPISNSRTKATVYKRENFIQVIPSTIYTTAEVAALSPQKRNCLLPHERKMKYTKYYTINNCLSDCQSKYRIRKCGCLFPLLITNPSRSNCTLDQYWCLMRILNFQDDGSSGITKTTDCNCLPECDKNDYNVLMTAGRFMQKVSYTYENVPKRAENFDTVVHVFIGDVMTTRIRRDISEDWFTTLSSYGGLLSLVMGFSIVSILEFIYIFTFQPNIDLNS